MSYGYRDLRILCGPELLHAVSQHGHVPGAPELAGGRPRKEAGRRVHQVRRLRTGMSPAHPHPGRAGESSRDTSGRDKGQPEEINESGTGVSGAAKE